MTALSTHIPPSDLPSIVFMGLCAEQERIFCVRCKSNCVYGICLGIAQTTSCIGMLFWYYQSCLPNFTTELSAPDRISALEVKLEKGDLRIAEIQSLKLEINSPKKPDHPYLRSAVRDQSDTSSSYRSSKKRKAEAVRTCLPTKSLKTEYQKF